MRVFIYACENMKFIDINHKIIIINNKNIISALIFKSTHMLVSYHQPYINYIITTYFAGSI